MNEGLSAPLSVIMTIENPLAQLCIRSTLLILRRTKLRTTAFPTRLLTVMPTVDSAAVSSDALIMTVTEANGAILEVHGKVENLNTKLPLEKA